MTAPAGKGPSDDLDWPTVTQDVAEELWDEPQWVLPTKSHIKKEWRWGTKGSRSLKLEEGFWYDWEARKGGNCLALIKRELGLEAKEAFEWMRAKGILPPDDRTVFARRAPEEQKRRDAEREAKRQQRNAERKAEREAMERQARALLALLPPARGTIAERYLRQRLPSLELPEYVLEELRFDPNHSFGEHGHHPAMIAPYRSVTGNQITGVHRTALKRDGSDRVREWNGAEWTGKKSFGTAGGSVIKLCPDIEVERRLGLSEGIENALVAIGRGWRPVWAAGCAGTLGAFPVLSGVDHLMIFGDAGETGEEAAAELKARWLAADRECRLRIPPAGDWNETLMRESP